MQNKVKLHEPKIENGQRKKNKTWLYFLSHQKERKKKKEAQTFIVDTLGREETVRGSNKGDTDVEKDEKPKANL